jgi:hypothetical protein
MNSLRNFAVVSVLALAGACSASSTPGSIVGRISISDPTANEMVTLPADNKVPVSFSTNYTLTTPGACGSQAACGSVHLLVDGTACNLSGTTYNTLATSSPSTVDLSLCMMAVGTHTIEAELINDGGTFVDDPITKDAITASVTITVQ